VLQGGNRSCIVVYPAVHLKVHSDISLYICYVSVTLVPMALCCVRGGRRGEDSYYDGDTACVCNVQLGVTIYSDDNAILMVVKHMIVKAFESIPSQDV